MIVSHKALNGPHLVMDCCRSGEEKKWRLLAEEDAKAGTETTITAYRIPSTPVTSFKYIGIVLSAADEKCPAVVHNLCRAHHKWERLSRVLGR